MIRAVVPNTFWHQGLVSRQTVVLRTSGGAGEMVQAVMRAMGERQMKFCLLAAHLLLCGPVPNRPVHGPGVGDTWIRVYAFCSFPLYYSWVFFFKWEFEVIRTNALRKN